MHPTYNRAGARTPMQWDDGPNAGFSTAAADRLYLPVDPAPDRPTVAAQLADEGSLLHLVRRLIALRRSTPALGLAGGDRGAGRRLPVRLPARRHPPGGGQPQRAGGDRRAAGSSAPARSLIGSGVARRRPARCAPERLRLRRVRARLTAGPAGPPGQPMRRTSRTTTVVITSQISAATP